MKKLLTKKSILTLFLAFITAIACMLSILTLAPGIVNADSETPEIPDFSTYTKQEYIEGTTDSTLAVGKWLKYEFKPEDMHYDEVMDSYELEIKVKINSDYSQSGVYNQFEICVSGYLSEGVMSINNIYVGTLTTYGLYALDYNNLSDDIYLYIHETEPEMYDGIEYYNTTGISIEAPSTAKFYILTPPAEQVEDSEEESAGDSWFAGLIDFVKGKADNTANWLSENTGYVISGGSIILFVLLAFALKKLLK